MYIYMYVYVYIYTHTNTLFFVEGICFQCLKASAVSAVSRDFWALNPPSGRHLYCWINAIVLSCYYTNMTDP